MHPTTEPTTAAQETADVINAFASTKTASTKAERTEPTPKKKKNILVRFLLKLIKSIVFIILVIVVSALLFVVFIDNAEAEALLGGIASGLANDAVSAVKGLFT